MEPSFGQWCALVFSAFTYGVTKTGFPGISTIAVPVMLYFFTPGQSLGITLPLLIFADIITITVLRRSVSWKNVFMGLPLGLVGVVCGWRILSYAQSLSDGDGDVLLRRIISAILVFVVVSGALLRLHQRREAKRGEQIVLGNTPRPMTPGRLTLSSLLAVFGGCITMLANNGGPVWVVYLMLFRLEKFFFLGTVGWIFFIQNVAKLPFSIQLGFVNRETLSLNLYLIPMVLLGLASGRAMVKRVSQKLFDNITQLAALAGALYLLLSR